MAAQRLSKLRSKLIPITISLFVVLVTVCSLYLISNWIFRVLVVGALSITFWWLLLSTSDIDDRSYFDLLSKRNLITDRYHLNKCTPSTPYDVVIIGSGTSSLHCGVVLCRMGYKVLVLEQHYVAGGGTHEFELTAKSTEHKTSKNKYSFDSGLHYAIPLSQDVMHLVCGTASPPVKWMKLGSDQTDGCYDWIVLGDSMPNKEDFFRIKHEEAHLPDLYRLFPKHSQDIDAILNAMGFAMKLFPFWVFQRVLPLWLQRIYRRVVLFRWLSLKQYAGKTTRSVLDTLTDNQRLKALVCGLWLDTGSPPNDCSFMLSSSVFRGFPHEGGAYPKGGSTELAKALCAIIKLHGGNVLCRAKVKRILVDSKGRNPEVQGVQMENGDEIQCRNVISGVGFKNTFHKLLNLPNHKLRGLDSSYSFLLCNVGLIGNHNELGIEDTNLWYLPINEGNGWSLFRAIDDFVGCDDPESALDDDSKTVDFCCGFTWPSLKAKGEDLSKSNTTSCQILVMAPWRWFARWHQNGAFKSGDTKNVNEEYQRLKGVFIRKCIEKLHLFYPQTRGKVDLIDLSTPLSLEYYLKSDKGGAIGLDVTPNRFVDEEILDLTDCDQNRFVKGLWMTGQDVLICGIPICQAAGVITAFRFAGFWKSVIFSLKMMRTSFRYHFL